MHPTATTDSRTSHSDEPRVGDSIENGALATKGPYGRTGKRLRDRIQSRVFGFVHGNNLVYNTCWEDPRLDHVALELGPTDRVMMITSAGCNALDYALKSPARIHCVDVNPRQNALLELKQQCIRKLDYDDFFAFFGRGGHPHAAALYRRELRAGLTLESREYWDRHIRAFSLTPARPSFYFHGTSGMVARSVNLYIDKVARVRSSVSELLAARSLEEQKDIYDRKLRRVFWTKFVRWIVSRDSTLSLLGVPRSQRLQVEKEYDGGIGRFIEDSIETVFTKLPIHDNYFWRVYLTGRYSHDCCPEYLKPDNFAKLKAGLVDRVTTHTMTILDFLRAHDVSISRYVLLDHMDWLSSFSRESLRDEWQAIVDRAAPDCRLIWRSGGLSVDYVDPLEVKVAGRVRKVGELLTYNQALANELHPKDRVHTYGSFYIANLKKE
jgi:S-adenosylmethionine-diacylglycerol 3-amino-3-carboxypropyl transferase